MPVLDNAKKQMRRAERKRVYNLRKKRAMKRAVKEVRELAEAGNIKAAKAKLPAAYKAIDKAAKRGVIKKNTAARKKSRLTSFVNKRS